MGKDLVGVICGFTRDNYLLMSEIAIDTRFQKRSFGKRLVKAFEQAVKDKFTQINAGAYDSAINFYKSLDYEPFLLIQFKKGDYSPKNFSKFKVIGSSPTSIEMEVKSCDIKHLQLLREKYPKAHFQYIFKKTL